MVPGRTEASFVSVLLTQRLVESDVAALTAGEYWALAAALGQLDALLGRPEASLVADFGLDRDLVARVVRRLDQATQVAFALDAAEQSGVRVLTAVDRDYPPVLRTRLAKAAPPLLYTVGDAVLLRGGGLAVVGSASVRAGAEGATVAAHAAEEAVARDTTVISGGGAGVAQIVMEAAAAASGVQAAVLAGGLGRAVHDPGVRRAVTDGVLCLCTPYAPAAPVTPAQALARHEVIRALATATLVIAAHAGMGITWEAIAGAIDAGDSPVLVWMGRGCGAGNEALVARGGRPIESLGGLFPLPDRVATAPPASHAGPVEVLDRPEQLRFDL